MEGAEPEEVLSHRSAGVTSNMTTPLRGSVSNLTSIKNETSTRRDSSRLKQPTPLRKSATLKATLSRIDSQSKLGSIAAPEDLVVQVEMSSTSRNSNNMAFLATAREKPFETDRRHANNYVTSAS